MGLREQAGSRCMHVVEAQGEAHGSSPHIVLLGVMGCRDHDTRSSTKMVDRLTGMNEEKA